MLKSKDQIKTFIPNEKPKLVILGTMASVAARSVSGKNDADKDSFYYHNKNNHFWRILQLVFEPNNKPQNFQSSADKKQFLNKWKIAMANIISEVVIDESKSMDPSDSVIFDAYSNGQVKFKTVSPTFKSILKTTPIFFTCSQNKYINRLLNLYFKKNNISLNSEHDVKFLMTPTRCNPLERSLGWKIRLSEFGVSTKKITIP